jgi:hypothetical protein
MRNDNGLKKAAALNLMALIRRKFPQCKPATHRITHATRCNVHYLMPGARCAIPWLFGMIAEITAVGKRGGDAAVAEFSARWWRQEYLDELEASSRWLESRQGAIPIRRFAHSFTRGVGPRHLAE